MRWRAFSLGDLASEQPKPAEATAPCRRNGCRNRRGLARAARRITGQPVSDSAASFAAAIAICMSSCVWATETMTASNRDGGR